MTESEFPSPIEAELRACAPVLPPSLKNRTLNACAARANARRQREQRFNRQFTWAVAVVLALQFVAGATLDAQNARLIAGNGAPPTFAAISVADVIASVQERSRQLAG